MTTLVAAIAVMLISSVLSMYTVEAKKKAYKIQATALFEDSCWNDITFKFVDSKSGHLIGKKTLHGDATFDDNQTDVDTTLKFDIKDVKSGVIKATIKYDGHGDAPYFQELDKKQHAYEITFGLGIPLKTNDDLCFDHFTD